MRQLAWRLDSVVKSCIFETELQETKTEEYGNFPTAAFYFCRYGRQAAF
jgi:hypothetical protein